MFRSWDQTNVAWISETKFRAIQEKVEAYKIRVKLEKNISVEQENVLLSINDSNQLST